MKEVTIKLDFIAEGVSSLTSWADAEDANSSPKNLKISTQTVQQGDLLKVKLADNGGWVARVTVQSSNLLEK